MDVKTETEIHIKSNTERCDVWRIGRGKPTSNFEDKDHVIALNLLIRLSAQYTYNYRNGG